MQNGYKSGGWLGTLWRSPLPAFGCEIAQPGISVARWSRSSGALEATSWRPIPSGAVEASPLRENLQQPEEVRKALGAALSSLGISSSADSSRLTDTVLIIPDQSARLFVLNFETFPEHVAEGIPLVKWRLKKSVPFDIGSASISYFVQRSGTELQAVAVATPQKIVQQYEKMAESFGLRPRRVILSTLASLALAGDLDGVRGAAGNGFLMAKYSPPWLTSVIVQGDVLRLFRTVALPAGEDGLPSVQDVLAAIYPSIAYFQDNFEGVLARAFLCGMAENTTPLADALQSEFSLSASSLMAELDGPVAGMDSSQAERHFTALRGIAREQSNR